MVNVITYKTSYIKAFVTLIDQYSEKEIMFSWTQAMPLHHIKFSIYIFLSSFFFYCNLISLFNCHTDQLFNCHIDQLPNQTALFTMHMKRKNPK